MRVLERALGILTTACGAAWALYVLALGSDAGLTVPVLLVLFWGGIAMLLLWCLRFGAHLLASRRTPERGHVRRLLAEPAALLLCFAIVWSGGAFWVRFLLSKAALDDYARTSAPLLASGNFTPGLRVGLFSLREAEVLPGGIVRVITTDCMFDHCGLVYSPNGEPPRVGEDTYSTLVGHWYHWWRSW